jgi:transcriptional regulator with XRE-family HTH domain
MNNNLRALREVKHLTQKDVEEKTGISYVILSRMENGLQDIQELYARQLSDLYGVSIDHLFARKFTQPDTVIYKDKPLTFSSIVSSLNVLSNTELALIAGTVEAIIQERSKPSPNQQLIKNEVDKQVKKTS